MENEILENIHFIIGLIISLSILDYLLTLKAKKDFEKELGENIHLENFELNPIWQKSIKQGKYNFKHLLTLIILTIIIVYIYYDDDSKILYEFFVGFFLILLVIVNTQHIQNIAISSFKKEHPTEIEGGVKLSMGSLYYTSMLSQLSMALLLIFVLFFNPSIFLFGGIMGILVYNLKQYSWYQNAMKEK
jgi:hypothetical protein